MAAGDWKELYLSAQTGDLELVRYHIRMGIDPNYQHPEFMTTPLIASIEQQHFEIAEYLLKNGADPTIKEYFGNHTPLSMAESTKNQKLINSLLIRNGVIKNSTTYKNITMLNGWKTYQVS